MNIKVGDLVKVVIDYEIKTRDGSKFNPKGRYGIVRTVHKEKYSAIGYIKYDCYVEIQGMPHEPLWFISEEVEIIS